jgi:hypothetical protein
MAGPLPGEVPSGAIMQPRYMGRVMNTYPVSESEMDHISSLSAQTTTRFSVATLLFGLGASIWVNATFYTEFTPEAKIATLYVAPFLVAASVGFILGGGWAQYKRRSAWERIKQTSNPVEAFATPLIVTPVKFQDSASADAMQSAPGAVGRNVS